MAATKAGKINLNDSCASRANPPVTKFALQFQLVTKETAKLKTVGAGIAIGVAIGVGIGVAMGNVGAGIAIGIAIGAAVGASRQKKDG